MDRLSFAFFAAALVLAGSTVTALALRTGAPVASASIPARFEGVIARGSSAAATQAPTSTLLAAAPAPSLLKPAPKLSPRKPALRPTPVHPETPLVDFAEVPGIAQATELAEVAAAKAEAHTCCRRQVERAKAWVRRVERAQSICTEGKTLTRVVVVAEADPIEG